MNEDVLFEIDGQIAVITLNRPEKLNAVTPEMADAVVAAVNECNDSDTIRCVIVTGAGDRAFCAGSDIRELDTYETPWQFRNRPDYCDAIRALLKPSIAAVNGYCLGGGLETAMSCDIRIASENAQFAAPEIKLGWIGGGGMAMHLAHSIGMSNAALMIMTGDPILADKALAWGLVSEVVRAGGAAAARQGDRPHDRRARPDRRGDRQAQPQGGAYDAAGKGDRIRARPADHLLCHRGRARRPRRIQGKARAGVPAAIGGLGETRASELNLRTLQGVVDARLPALSCSLEFGDNVGIEADGDDLLGIRQRGRPRERRILSASSGNISSMAGPLPFVRRSLRGFPLHPNRLWCSRGLDDTQACALYWSYELVPFSQAGGSHRNNRNTFRSKRPENHGCRFALDETNSHQTPCPHWEGFRGPEEIDSDVGKVHRVFFHIGEALAFILNDLHANTYYV